MGVIWMGITLLKFTIASQWLVQTHWCQCTLFTITTINHIQWGYLPTSFHQPQQGTSPPSQQSCPNRPQLLPITQVDSTRYSLVLFLLLARLTCQNMLNLVNDPKWIINIIETNHSASWGWVPTLICQNPRGFHNENWIFVQLRNYSYIFLKKWLNTWHIFMFK